MVLWIATAVYPVCGNDKRERKGRRVASTIDTSVGCRVESSARKSTEMDVCYKKRGRSKEASRAAWGSSGPPNTEYKSYNPIRANAIIYLHVDIFTERITERDMTARSRDHDTATWSFVGPRHAESGTDHSTATRSFVGKVPGRQQQVARTTEYSVHPSRPDREFSFLSSSSPFPLSHYM